MKGVYERKPRQSTCPRRQSILDFIQVYLTRNGYSPTYEEIRSGVGLGSTNTVEYDAKDEKIKHYRVDKMLRIRETGEPRIGKEVYRVQNYTNQSVFGMFGGKLTYITLEAENKMAGILIDRFGKDIRMVPLSETHFEAGVEVALSLQFYGWLISLGQGVRLTGPTPAVNELKAHLKRLNVEYNV